MSDELRKDLAEDIQKLGLRAVLLRFCGRVMERRWDMVEMDALVARCAIKRNGRFLAIAAEQDPVSAEIAAKTAMADSTHEDKLVGDDLESEKTWLSTMFVDLSVLAELAGDEWDGRYQYIVQLTGDKQRLERRVSELNADLNARRMEHPPHKSWVRDKVWDSTGGLCFYCQTVLVRETSSSSSEDEKRRVFHVDHVVPKDNGGPDHLSNYVPACGACNMSKSTKPLVEFVEALKRPSAPVLKVVEGGAA